MPPHVLLENGVVLNQLHLCLHIIKVQANPMNIIPLLMTKAKMDLGMRKMEFLGKTFKGHLLNKFELGN